jgi:hypothetical protein
MANDIVNFVDKYTYENGRGCPKGVLIHVGGFKAKDIAALLENGSLESGRGSEGGIFVAGCKPSPRTIQNVSLKSRMADFLRLLNDANAVALVAEYDAELKRRADAQD